MSESESVEDEEHEADTDEAEAEGDAVAETEGVEAEAEAESESEADAADEPDVTGEHGTRRTDDRRQCRRCGRPQGLVGKYEIFLCRQCFREVARGMGFKKYR